MCMCVHMTLLILRSADKIQELIFFSFYNVSCGDGEEVFRLGVNALYLLSHLDGPIMYFYESWVYFYIFFATH